jgi:hypothetical protein
MASCGGRFNVKQTVSLLRWLTTMVVVARERKLTVCFTSGGRGTRLHRLAYLFVSVGGVSRTDIPVCPSLDKSPGLAQQAYCAAMTDRNVCPTRLLQHEVVSDDA